MLIRRSATLCTLTIYLAGCATSYSPPKEGPTATLLFNGAPSAYFGSGNLKALGGRAAFKLVNDLVACKDDVRLADGLEVGQSESKVVSAGHPIAIKFLYGQMMPLTYCETSIQFLPESGAVYSLRFDENSFQQGKCVPKLERQIHDGDGYTNVQFLPACSQR